MMQTEEKQAQATMDFLTAGTIMTTKEKRKPKIYFTLTGTQYYFGKEFLKKGMYIKLEKEPDNKHDKEAIKVMYEGLGKIGYVANSPYTVIGESMSAGRLYDKIGQKGAAKVVLVTSEGVLCKICKKSILRQEGMSAGEEQSCRDLDI